MRVVFDFHTFHAVLWTLGCVAVVFACLTTPRLRELCCVPGPGNQLVPTHQDWRLGCLHVVATIIYWPALLTCLIGFVVGVDPHPTTAS